MSKARDIARAGTALSSVDATELGYLDGVTSAVQTQIDAKASTSTVSTHTGASTGVHGVTGSVVGTSDTQTLSAKTLTSPTINNGYLFSPTEFFLVGTYTGGTLPFDLKSYAVAYSSASSIANTTVNLRGDSTTTLNSILSVGQSITFSLVVNNGATPYYVNGVQVDGSAVTPKWSSGTAPTTGNANSLDIYSFTVMKTSATPTYVVLAAGPIKYA